VLRLAAFPLALVVIALVTSAGRADGPADFLVERLNIHEFRGVIYDLAALETRWWRRPKNTIATEYIRDALDSYGYANVVMHEYTYSGRTKHNVYATRVGSVRPDEMYIVGAHLDSYNRHGDYAHCPGADDDASGVAAVLEAARVFARARPEVSVRFALWNNEETGLNGSRAYVAERRGLQGTPEEPTWLGMIALDMILYDHGPGPVPDADVEYQANHDYDGQARALAEHVAGAMPRYGDILAEVGDNMNNTDSVAFWNDTAAISIRENQRISELGAGSNPHWHEATDLYETYTDADYEFGFNIVKMLVGAVGELAGANVLGDVDHDGDVDQSDLAALLVSYGRCAGHPDYNPDADFDWNGCVDLSDLAELLGYYGEET
jgi:hypothetical protein